MIPADRISRQTKTMLALWGDGYSVEQLADAAFRGEAKLEGLKRQLEANRDDPAVLRKVYSHIDRWNAALTEIRHFSNPSSVGSPFGGESQDTRMEDLGLAPCSVPACPELTDPKYMYFRAGRCESCWAKEIARNPALEEA